MFGKYLDQLKLFLNNNSLEVYFPCLFPVVVFCIDYCIFTNSEKPPDGIGESHYFIEGISRKNWKNPLFKLKLFFFPDMQIY